MEDCIRVCRLGLEAVMRSVARANETIEESLALEAT